MSGEIMTGISKADNKPRATLGLYMHVSCSLVSHTLVCLDKPLRYDITVFTPLFAKASLLANKTAYHFFNQ